jgi:ADP-ribosyl-[dinitrogen reductase] hydrolase
MTQPQSNDKRYSRDRALGAFVGLAIGDALGALVEFCRRDTFEPVTDMRAGGYFKLPVGAWTDDTAMALCLHSIHSRLYDAQF